MLGLVGAGLMYVPAMLQDAHAGWWCEEPPLHVVVPLVERVHEEYGNVPVMRIAGGSMEPQYKIGDHVIVDSTYPYQALRIGDIITFWDPRHDIGERTIIHRIVDVTENRVITKGDANHASASYDWADRTTYIGLVHPEPYRFFSEPKVEEPMLVRYGDYDMELVGMDGCPYVELDSGDGTHSGALLNSELGWTKLIEGHTLINAMMYVRSILYDLQATVPERTDDTDTIGADFRLDGLPVYDAEPVTIDDAQYVVVATGTDGIYIMDMEDPHNPRVAGSYDMRTYDVETLDGWPYIAVLHSSGIDMLSIANMDNIRRMDSIEGNEGHAVLVGFDETVMLVTTVGHGVIRQYDVTNPRDIEKAGAHYEDFVVDGVDIQIHERNGRLYALLDAGNRGILSYVISAERGPSPVRYSGIDYDDTIHTVVTVGDTKYRIVYEDGHVLVHEGTSRHSDPVGSLMVSDVYEINSMKVDGRVYAVIAAGDDGVLGIHIGDEPAGEWTFN